MVLRSPARHLAFGVVPFARGGRGRVAAAPSCVVLVTRPSRRVAGGASAVGLGEQLVRRYEAYAVTLGALHEALMEVPREDV